MSLVGMDLNASRARAVTGSATHKLSLVRLDGDYLDLPLAISLEGKQPVVGRAGLALTRARPHLACLDFLPHLGSSHIWSAGPHQLDADRALMLTFASLSRALGRTSGIALTIPAYLDEGQMRQFYRVVEQSGLAVLGSMVAPVAAVLGSSSVTAPEADLLGEPGLILVIDVDGHALTWSVVERGSTQLRLRLVQPAPQLGRVIWLRKLLDAVAHRCIRQSRRDPRESALTEQAVYEQLVAAVDQPELRLWQLQLQGAGWFTHLMLHADELTAFVAPLLRQFLNDLESILTTIDSLGSMVAVIVTHSAAGLPGLVPALRARIQARARTQTPLDESADYGDQLVGAVEMVHVLSQDALACTAHELAVRVHRGDFPRGHHEAIAFRPDRGTAPDPGPARLTFRGRDHLLRDGTFSLGRDPSCDLVFETELYPHVSARHCEIVFDRRCYLLCDRSRHGTLLNDRPIQQQAALHSGDWIRLGPRGPVLRFLGQTRGKR
jgi:hypothetical protein